MNQNKRLTCQKFFKNLVLAFFTVLLVSNTSLSYAQNAPTDIQKTWDTGNSNLKINAPLASEIESDQVFFLRYTQNVDSFYDTKSINWKIFDTKNNSIYQRQVDSNQDRNDPVKIENPGNYEIQLTLNIGQSTISTSRKLKVIPEDVKYFNGLKINKFINPEDTKNSQEISNSQIQLYNNSDTDLDISKVSLEVFKTNQSDPILIPVNFNNNPFLPKKSYLNSVMPDQTCAMDNSTKQPNCKEINLVYVKNSDKISIEKSTFVIDKYEIPTTSQAAPQAALNIAEINKTTIRTGGFNQSVNQSIFNIIPFLLIGLFYSLSLVFENIKSYLDVVNESIIKLKLIYLKFYFDWIITFRLFK